MIDLDDSNHRISQFDRNDVIDLDDSNHNVNIDIGTNR